ncbi:MAG TPA: sensor histidine kinase [Firmicutes bacterium]|nr:sensor histidine kinase [Bacillota bacterium]
MNPEYIGMLLPLPIIICFILIILIVYFHFNITKPLQVLNSGLEMINIRRPFAPLNSKRKDEIGDLYNRFNEMERRLHLARKEQTDMIAAIAHDLKTPLTSINGFVELLAMQKNLPEKEKQEYYELIQKKSKHIEELIRYFSSFTKEELELESIDLKPVEALKLFENIAVEYETELSGLDYELIWHHSFTANRFLMIDEHMIRRVFGNLFSNIVRYGGKKELKVYMNGYTQGGYAYFQVEDNGAGVPDKDLSSLFLKFYTVDKSRQSQNGGMGLGLASCKSIIEHHGGEIWAFHSKYGGLGIQFSLPLAM